MNLIYGFIYLTFIFSINEWRISWWSRNQGSLTELIEHCTWVSCCKSLTTWVWFLQIKKVWCTGIRRYHPLHELLNKWTYNFVFIPFKMLLLGSSCKICHLSGVVLPRFMVENKIVLVLSRLEREVYMFVFVIMSIMLSHQLDPLSPHTFFPFFLGTPWGSFEWVLVMTRVLCEFLESTECTMASFFLSLY